jgi:hypothetical protein
MKARWTSQGALQSVAMVFFLLPPAVTETLAELQARFDRETNAVHKAKLLERLGDAEFEETRRAGKAGDHATVALTLEKYRDNARAALELLKKQHPDAERQSNGYRQLQFHVRRAIREVDESMLMAPDEYKPPLQIVRGDLIVMDDEMIKLLFPGHPAKPAKTPPSAEKKP